MLEVEDGSEWMSQPAPTQLDDDRDEDRDDEPEDLDEVRDEERDDDLEQIVGTAWLGWIVDSAFLRAHSDAPPPNPAPGPARCP